MVVGWLERVAFQHTQGADISLHLISKFITPASACLIPVKPSNCSVQVAAWLP